MYLLCIFYHAAYSRVVGSAYARLVAKEAKGFPHQWFADLVGRTMCSAAARWSRSAATCLPRESVFLKPWSTLLTDKRHVNGSKFASQPSQSTSLMTVAKLVRFDYCQLSWLSRATQAIRVQNRLLIGRHVIQWDPSRWGVP